MSDPNKKDVSGTYQASSEDIQNSWEHVAAPVVLFLLLIVYVIGVMGIKLWRKICAVFVKT